MRNNGTERTDSVHQPARSSWRIAIISTIASLITFTLHVVYGHVHWNILARGYANMAPEDREKYLLILNILEIHRIIGLLALVFAVVAIMRKPRWPALIYGPLAGLAALTALIVM